MASAVTVKPEMSRYLQESTKTGDFNPRRTLSVSFFVIPERLASILSVVHGFGVLVGNSQNWEISKKWQSAVTEKPETSQYLQESTKTGDFNPRSPVDYFPWNPVKVEYRIQDMQHNQTNKQTRTKLVGINEE